MIYPPRTWIDDCGLIIRNSALISNIDSQKLQLCRRGLGRESVLLEISLPRVLSTAVSQALETSVIGLIG